MEACPREDILRFNFDDENEAIRNYSPQIRQILLQEEQDHQIALATALGIDVPIVGIAD